KPADVVIDLHGGDLDEDLRPYSYWFRGGQPAQDSASRALALAFGLDHIIVRDFDLGDAASRRNLGGYAMSLGKTVLVAEAGRSWATPRTTSGDGRARCARPPRASSRSSAGSLRCGRARRWR